MKYHDWVNRSKLEEDYGARHLVDQFIRKIDQKKAEIGIIGLGICWPSSGLPIL